jgi:hypothetical protein
MGIPEFPDASPLRVSRPEKFANASQVFGRVDAWAWRFFCDMNSNFVPMPQGAKLL